MKATREDGDLTKGPTSRARSIPGSCCSLSITSSLRRKTNRRGASLDWGWSIYYHFLDGLIGSKLTHELLYITFSFIAPSWLNPRHCWIANALWLDHAKEDMRTQHNTRRYLELTSYALMIFLFALLPEAADGLRQHVCQSSEVQLHLYMYVEDLERRRTQLISWNRN